MCWREETSTLHIPFIVKCFEGIASLTTFARNDEKEEVARYDVMGNFVRNDEKERQFRNDARVLFIITTTPYYHYDSTLITKRRRCYFPNTPTCQ